jgi:hypothetical protein
VLSTAAHGRSREDFAFSRVHCETDDARPFGTLGFSKRRVWRIGAGLCGNCHRRPDARARGAAQSTVVALTAASRQLAAPLRVKARSQCTRNGENDRQKVNVPFSVTRHRKTSSFVNEFGTSKS